MGLMPVCPSLSSLRDKLEFLKCHILGTVQRGRVGCRACAIVLWSIKGNTDQPLIMRVKNVKSTMQLCFSVEKSHMYTSLKKQGRIVLLHYNV